MTTFEMEHEYEGRHLGLILAGIFVGGMIGAVTLLLTAPQSGKDTRKLIQTKTIELRDRTATTLENVSGQVSSKAGEIKTDVNSKVMELTQKGKGMLAKQLERISVAAKNGRNSLQGKAR